MSVYDGQDVDVFCFFEVEAISDAQCWWCVSLLCVKNAENLSSRQTENCLKYRTAYGRTKDRIVFSFRLSEFVEGKVVDYISSYASVLRTVGYILNLYNFSAMIRLWTIRNLLIRQEV